MPLVSGYAQESLNQPTNAASVIQPQPVANASVPAPAAPDLALAAPGAGDDVVDAPARPMSTAKSLPDGVRLTGPVAEVIRLANSGVEEGVLLAFVTNSPSLFNLGAEEIIYLNDIGVPSVVVTAMIQRDQALRALPANAAAAPLAPAPIVPAPYPPEPVPAPAPEEMAPQPDYSTEIYPPVADNSYASFYDPLAPYGTWIDVAGYGPCWQPTVVIVNPDWQPYCNGGHWAYTEYGWCWVPGNVWGPSWVCWRYNGNYCGWAPLPPASAYHAGVGLTYHGQHVSGGFGFGLSAGSYTFVHTSHFTDRHVNRYALPHQQAAQVYNQTVTSATIVGNSTRVFNRGIPVARVEMATHAQIRPLNIRDANGPGAVSTRGERLEANRQTLSVYRPQFPQSAGTLPAYNGMGVRPGSSSAGGLPGSAAQRVAPASAPRTVGGSPGAQPISGGGSGRRPDRSPNQASAGPGQPIILHGRQDAVTRSAGAQRNQPFLSADAEVRAQAQPSWSAPRAYAPAVRSEQPPQYTAPAYRAPAEMPRSAPAPQYAPPHMQSYAAPAPAPAPRAEPTVSQPVHSAPSAPAPSLPAQSSSGKNGR